MKIYKDTDQTFKLIPKKQQDFVIKHLNGKKVLNGKMFVLVMF